MYILIHNQGGFEETVKTNTSNFTQANAGYKEVLDVFKNSIEIQAEKSKEEVTNEIYESMKSYIVC
jgi:thymidylate kinase